MIYFAKIDSGLIKIGTTKNLKARLVGLRDRYGRGTHFLKCVPGDRKEETRYHLRFAHLRIEEFELFNPEPDLIEFIENLEEEGSLSKDLNLSRPMTELYINFRLDDEFRRNLEALREFWHWPSGRPYTYVELIREAVAICAQASREGRDLRAEVASEEFSEFRLT